MDEETLDLSQTSELGITARLKSLLRTVSAWCKVTAIFGFLLTSAGLVFFVLALNSYSNDYNGSVIREDEIVALTLIIAASSAVFFISKFLLDYSRNLKKCFAQNSDVYFEKALKGLRNAMALIAVIWGLALLFILFLALAFLYFMVR